MISEQLIQPRRTVLLFGGVFFKKNKQGWKSQTFVRLQMSYKRLKLKSLKVECLKSS